MKIKLVLVSITLLLFLNVKATIINANPSNYASLLTTLLQGDTLMLASGNYTDRLNIFSLVGTSSNPIVIIGSGNSTIFLPNPCCNTVSIKESEYIILKDFKIDVQNIAVDGIKAEGTTGNWAHHITIENITVIGTGTNQQIVGISTKCPVWDWVIKGCTIDGLGTGVYLGNSDGTSPFVNGIIEYNLIKNTIGYNIEIKHQNVGSRNIAGMTLNGKTIIRHNVLSKENNSSSGGSARPNLLVGAFPASGDGANDFYEIYGNFIWQNPFEALFQGTGNIMFYDNVCVNYAGGNGVGFQTHNSFAPRDIKVFSNTIVTDISWGIRLMDTDPAFQKYVYGNAIFSDHATPIRVVGGGAATANLLDNVTDIIANANNYVNNVANNINTLDLYPTAGSPLNSTAISNTLFTTYVDYDKDFNLDLKTWNYRGAYTGEGTNTGWHLAIELKPQPSIVTSVSTVNAEGKIKLYPNPTIGAVTLDFPQLLSDIVITVRSIDGKIVLKKGINKSQKTQLNISDLTNGIYFISIKANNYFSNLKLIKK